MEQACCPPQEQRMMGLVGMFPNNMLMGVAGGGTLWLLTGDTTSMEGDVEEDLAFPII